MFPIQKKGIIKGYICVATKPNTVTYKHMSMAP